MTNKYEFTGETQVMVGDFITVRCWLSHRDNSYRGDCLEVTAVDLPFLCVIRHPARGYGPITLNLEQVEVQPLSAAFVQEVLRTEPQGRAARAPVPLRVTYMASQNPRPRHL